MDRNPMNRTEGKGSPGAPCSACASVHASPHRTCTHCERTRGSAIRGLPLIAGQPTSFRLPRGGVHGINWNESRAGLAARDEGVEAFEPEGAPVIGAMSKPHVAGGLVLARTSGMAATFRSDLISGLPLGFAYARIGALGDGYGHDHTNECECCPVKIETLHRPPTADANAVNSARWPRDHRFLEEDGRSSGRLVHRVKTIFQVRFIAATGPGDRSVANNGCKIVWEERSNKPLSGDRNGNGAHNAVGTWRDRVSDFQFIEPTSYASMREFEEDSRTCNGVYQAYVEDQIHWPTPHSGCQQAGLTDTWKLEIRIRLTGPDCVGLCKLVSLVMEKTCRPGRQARGRAAPWELTKAELSVQDCPP